MTTSVPLTDAATHFGVPRTTLRDLIDKHGIPTGKERIKRGRSVQEMTVLPPSSLERIAALLAGEAGEGDADVQAVTEQPVGDTAQSQYVAKLEALVAELQAQAQAVPVAPLVRRRRRGVDWRRLALAVIDAGERICGAVMWATLPPSWIGAKKPGAEVYRGETARASKLRRGEA